MTLMLSPVTASPKAAQLGGQATAPFVNVELDTTKFCNPDYITAPGEVLDPLPCPPVIDCNSGVLWDVLKKFCSLVI